MFFEFYRREIGRTLRRPVFYLLLLPMAALAYFFAANDNPHMNVMLNIGRAWHNSPVVLARLYANFSQFALLFSVLVTARAIAADFEMRVDTLLFTTPIRKFDYLFGRFAAGVTATLIAYALIPLAFAAGCRRISAEAAGPVRLDALVQALIVFVIPNIVLISAVLFALSALTRRMTATYIAAVVIWGLLANLRLDEVSRFRHPLVASLLDPTGIVAVRFATQFWSIERQNTDLVSIAGPLLWNRCIWIAVSAAVLYATYRRFHLIGSEERPKKNRQRPDANLAAPLIQPSIPIVAGVPRAEAQFLRLMRRESRELLLNPWLLVPLVLGVSSVVTNLGSDAGANDAVLYATASRYAPIVAGVLQPYIVALTVFFAGVIVWRERDRRMDPLLDTYPIRNWMVAGSKILALVTLQVSLQLTGVLAALFLQWQERSPSYDLSVYAGIVGVETVRNALLAIAAVFLQSVSRNKYVGFFATALVAAIPAILEQFGVTQRLIAYRAVPFPRYSELVGFGQYAAPAAWYLLYWSAAAAMLLLVTVSAFPRGTDRTAERIAHALQDTRTRNGVAAALISFALIGSWIFWNTRVLHWPETDEDIEAKQALYERKYKHLEHLPQPAIDDVRLTVDIFPRERRVQLAGTYRMVNATASPVREIYVTFTPPAGSTCRVSVDRPTKGIDVDLATGVRRIELVQPLLRGASAKLFFELSIRNDGLRDEAFNDDIVENGTLLSNLHTPAYFPMIGYDARLTLRDPEQRAKNGLPPSAMPLPLDGSQKRPMLSDRAIVETNVSTDRDQIAIAPGELRGRMETGSRVQYRYRTSSPILFQGGMAVVSGRFVATRASHRDLSIEVYCDRRHLANVPSMIEGVRRAYDACVPLYGRYPHRTLRIAEVPSYQKPPGTAAAFAGLIAVRETGGFLTDLRDRRTFDTVFSTLTHEMAHQWWPHQFPPAISRGANVLVETLPQWTRLVAIEHELGAANARRFRAGELRAYLEGRATSRERERPLLEADEPYLVYRKASIVLAAVRKRLGEAAVNGALSSLAREIARDGLIPTTADLHSHLLRAAMPEDRAWLTEQLKEVVLYDLHATIAGVQKRQTNEYRVEVEVISFKYRLSGDGREVPVRFSEPVELAITDAKGTLLHLSRVMLEPGRRSFTLTLPDAPARAELDPAITMLTRTPR